MKTDQNPSVICALFCTQQGYKNFLKEVDQRKGMRVRELKFVDISIPLDDNFNDNLNFLKHGSMPILKRFVEMELPFGIKEKFLKKLKLKEFDYSNEWKYDNKNPLLYAGITPLAVDDKYNNDDNYTKEEQEKMKRLISWDTPDYKEKLEGVYDK